MPREYKAYDLVWVDAWRADQDRSRLCVRQFEADQQREDILLDPWSFWLKTCLLRFLRREISWWCLVQWSAALFVCSPSAPMSHLRMHEDATDKELPASPAPAYSSICGSRDGCAPDVDRMNARSSSTVQQRLKTIRVLHVQFSALAQSVSKFDIHVQTITNAVTILTTRIARIEQNVSALADRMFAIETGATSAFKCLWISCGISCGILTWTSWWLHKYLVP